MEALNLPSVMETLGLLAWHPLMTPLALTVVSPPHS